MNRYARALALFLIERRLKKMERKAFRKIHQERKMRTRMRPIDYVENPKEYRELQALRSNIEGINGPWQGAMARSAWTRAAKHKKYIKPFPEQKFEPVEEPPLCAAEQRWADMSLEEFMEEIHGRTSK